MKAGQKRCSEKMIMEEVVALNEDFAFPNTLTVAVEEYGKPNAIYIPNELRVLMCAEHAQSLRYLPLPQ